MNSIRPTKVNDEVPLVSRYCHQCEVRWCSRETLCWNCGQLGTTNPINIHYKTEKYQGVYNND